MIGTVCRVEGMKGFARAERLPRNRFESKERRGKEDSGVEKKGNRRGCSEGWGGRRMVEERGAGVGE